jgi:hypothetical protein
MPAPQQLDARAALTGRRTIICGMEKDTMTAKYSHAAWLVAGFASCAVSAVSADDDDVNAVPNSYSVNVLVTGRLRVGAPHRRESQESMGHRLQSAR